MAAFNLASKMAAKLSFQVYLEFTVVNTKHIQICCHKKLQERDNTNNIWFTRARLLV